MCQASSCFEQATWPKLIGYGKADTEVLEIDRRGSDGMLVLLIKTDEDDLVKNAGTSSDSRSVTTLDVSSNVYLWWKVLTDVRTGYSHVYFSPDGSKVLAAMYHMNGEDKERTMVYLDAEDGALLA